MIRVSLIILFISGVVSIINAQIPNPGFENWYNGPNGYDPVGWITSNATPFVSVEPTTPGHQGTYAVEVKAWQAGVTVANGVCQSNPFWFSSRPTALSGFVKCSVMPNDSVSIVITVTNGGISGQAVGAARLVYTSEISTFTAFSLPIHYGSSSATDTIYIDIFAGSGFSPVVGTEIIVDDLSLSPATGIGQTTEPAAGSIGQSYPNPSQGFMTIPLNLASGGNINIAIFDITGKEIKTVLNEFLPAGEQKINVSVAGLADGVYYYTIQGDNFTGTKKFTIRK